MVIRAITGLFPHRYCLIPVAKFACYPLLIHSLRITCCGNHLLQKSLITHCKSHSFLKSHSILVLNYSCYLLKKSLVAKKTLTTSCRLLVTRYRNCLLQRISSHSIWKSPARNISCLNSTKLGKTFSLFKMICFLKAKNWRLFHVNVLRSTWY